MIQAQRYRHRVQIQRLVHAQDPASLESTFTWQTLTVSGVALAAVPAQVLTGPGKEMDAANSKQGERVIRVNMRWFAGLDQSMRIIWDGVPYDISSIEMDETARREYRLVCSAGVNSG